MSDVGGGDVAATGLTFDERENLWDQWDDADSFADLIPTINRIIAVREAAAEQRGRQAALREAAADIYNGAGDPEQEFYDRGVSPWLSERADRIERDTP